MRRALLLLLVLVAAGGWLIAGAGGDLRREHVTSAGVPLDVVHPVADGRRPGVVVAHGFSGSAKLMAPFGDTLAARGYTVVLLDFSGHGATTHPLPDQTASTDASTRALQSDLTAAVAHLRSLPDVDPARIALVGHSMGAGAVTRYAAAHPDITATVAISLPNAVVASAERPAHLLTVVGALEFPGFREAATTVAAQRADRGLKVVTGVEHISVLYAPETHRTTAAWLDRALGGPFDDDAVPFPGRRLAGAALLGLAFLLGLHPLAARLGERRTAPPSPMRARITVTAVATGAAVVGALTARLLPTTAFPLAIGGYVAAYAAVTGVLLLLYAIRRGHHTPERPAHPRVLTVVPYAVAAIAVPVHLGMTNALPAGARWWLLPIIWAAFALLAYATERATDGDPVTLLAVAAVFVTVLAAAALTGLTHGFVVLVLVPLIGLLLWQTLCSVFLNRFGFPTWVVALTGSIVVTWPLAVTLPLTG
ncbi:dienelactone hydrolase family protein [Actinoplanes xinjiangensis]|uniref:dienelactone hydrolase family protein n=1 Tax=Actinoplanes xinjiangensis TaxID=512350 RepID=UPI003424D1C6